MSIPVKFQNDINSNQVNIFTRVIIQDSIYLSTHNINFDGNYYKPILLNIPAIKESVDYEKRNFKTSSLNLQISNYEFNGEIFSDILKSNPLINSEVDVYLHTQSAVNNDDSLLIFKGYVSRTSHTESEVNITLEDLTESKMSKIIPAVKTSTSKSIHPKYRNKIIPIVYGHLEQAPAIIDSGDVLKADSDSSVSLVSSTADEYLNIGTAVNYAHHPVWNNFSEWGCKGVSPVMVYMDNVMAYIPIKTTQSLEDDDNLVYNTLDYQQWTTDNLENQGSVALKPELLSDVEFPEQYRTLQCIPVFKPNKVSCNKRDNAGDWMSQNDLAGELFNWHNNNLFLEKMNVIVSDDDYSFKSLEVTNNSNPYSYWTNTVIQEGATLDYDFVHDQWYANHSLLKIVIDADSGVDHTSLSHKSQIAINGFLFPIITNQWHDSSLYMIPHDNSDNLTFPGGQTDQTFAYVTYAGDNSNYNADFMQLGQQFNEIFVDSEIDSSPKDLFLFASHYGEPAYQGLDEEGDNQIIFETAASITPGSYFDTDSPHENFIHRSSYVILQHNSSVFNLMLGINYYFNDQHTNEDMMLDLFAKIRGQLNEIDLATCCNFEYKSNMDFFLNVNGRLEDGVVIKNPITIIRNIAITELGLDPTQIDESSYLEAESIHSHYEFAFSVNKKIKGKKLLEDIAKSTLCYPYFDNKGKLHFPSIKPLYNQADDYEINAKEIKDSEVISYSFQKTKHENCYSRISFDYNYNYAAKTYDSKLESGLYPQDNELKYNAHVDFNGNADVNFNVLDFESKYIKNYETANLVWERMFRFHKHQHLLCKIKLPLKYIDVNVGDLIKFDKLIQGLKAFGIDYTKLTSLAESQNAGSIFYPLFFVISSIKNLDYVEIQAIQLNTLETLNADEWNEEFFEFDYQEPTDDDDDDDAIVDDSDTGEDDSSLDSYWDLNLPLVPELIAPEPVILDNLIYGGNKYAYSDSLGVEHRWWYDTEFYLFGEENVIIEGIAPYIEDSGIKLGTYYVPNGAFYGHPINDNVIISVMYSHSNVGWGVNYDDNGSCHYGLVTETNHNGAFEFIGHNVFKIGIFHTAFHTWEEYSDYHLPSSDGTIPAQQFETPKRWEVDVYGDNGLRSFFTNLSEGQNIIGQLELLPHRIWGLTRDWDIMIDGDINFDGELEIADVTTLIAMLQGTYIAPPLSILSGDINDDWMLDYIDFYAILQQITNW